MTTTYILFGLNCLLTPSYDSHFCQFVTLTSITPSHSHSWLIVAFFSPSPLTLWTDTGTVTCEQICSCFFLFTARRYASASTCYGLCLCLSQVGVLLKWLNNLGWFHAWKLLSTYRTLCFKEIWVPPEIRVHPSRTSCSLEPHPSCPYSWHRKFCHYRSSLKCLINLAWHRSSVNKVDNTSKRRQSTAGLSQWSSSSVYNTIPSHGFISDNWYLFHSAFLFFGFMQFAVDSAGSSAFECM